MGQVWRERVQRTQRKSAIQMPTKIAYRFERDISNGPSFLSFLVSSSFCALVWPCEGVVRSGFLSEDMAVLAEQAANYVTTVRLHSIF